MPLPDLSNYKISEEEAERFFKYLEELEEGEIKSNNNADILHESLKELDSLDDYLENLSKLESNLDYGQELPEYWDLIKVAERHGKLLELTPEVNEEINTFISSFFHYKDYIFGTMHGQGSCPWFVKYSEYEHLLGPEQLSFKF